MRKFVPISPKPSYQCNIACSLFYSTQKLQFSARCNGQIVKHHCYMHFLEHPSEVRTFDETKTLHALLITAGSSPMQEPIFLQNRIISKYGSLGELTMARKLFNIMPQRNAISYNTMIGSYSRGGLLEEALDLFLEMKRCDLLPTEFTFCSLLSCHSPDVFFGMQLHGLIEKIGLLYTDAFAGTALLGMYGRYGYLNEAIAVFQDLPNKNIVTWNSMISMFKQMGFIDNCIFVLSEMMRSRIEMSACTFVSVLSGLQNADMLLGQQLHGLVIKYGFNNVASVSNCLINMYAKFAVTHLAEKIFEEAPFKDCVSWNSLIGAVANSDFPTKTLNIYMKMCMVESPNEITLVNVLHSCTRMHIISYGEYMHAKIIKKGLDCGVYIGSALVDFYAKCNKMQEAHLCFDGITVKNLVSWNSLMLGYSNRGSSDSVSLFQETIHLGYHPNELSFSIVVKSAPTVELLQLHSLAIKMGYQENDYVSSSLICAYAKNGLLSDALVFVGSDATTLPVVSSNIIASIYNSTGQYDKTQELYAAIEDPDAISWNILIAACSRTGHYRETFELFDCMRKSQICPDKYTYISLFSVCTKLCNLALGSSLHGLILKTNFNLCDTFAYNTMIDMYGKCGNLQSSVKIFNEIMHKNVISWTALVSVLGLHGYTNEAIKKFREMEKVGFRPDNVAFIAILSACRHGGLVKEGMELFREMKSKYDVEPELDHYVLVVDLLARNGHLKEAEKQISEMPIPPNAEIWRCFLQGCKNQRNLEQPVLMA